MRWDSYENFNLHHEDSADGVWGAPRGGVSGGHMLPSIDRHPSKRHPLIWHLRHIPY